MAVRVSPCDDQFLPSTVSHRYMELINVPGVLLVNNVKMDSAVQTDDRMAHREE